MQKRKKREGQGRNIRDEDTGQAGGPTRRARRRAGGGGGVFFVCFVFGQAETWSLVKNTCTFSKSMRSLHCASAATTLPDGMATEKDPFVASASAAATMNEFATPACVQMRYTHKAQQTSTTTRGLESSRRRRKSECVVGLRRCYRNLFVCVGGCLGRAPSKSQKAPRRHFSTKGMEFFDPA